jgi:hypothetical protein
MTSARFVFLAALLLGSAAFAHADGVPVDPVIDVSDPLTCGEGCTSVGQDLSFIFFSDGAGGGINLFQNNSGMSWFNLLVETGSSPFNVPASTVTCTSNAFQTCQVSDLAGGITAMFLSGLSETFTGIPNGAFFTIELNDIKGIDGGSWGPFREFDAKANTTNPVPEPATLTLLGVGLGALVAKRAKRWLPSQRQARS